MRYRATAILRRPQIKQYTASNEGSVQNQRGHHIIFKKMMLKIAIFCHF